jgi:hypothetical protein
MPRENHQTTPSIELSLRALELGNNDALPAGVSELQRTAPCLRGDSALALRSAPAPAGVRVVLFNGERCVATGSVFRAESAGFCALTGLSEAALDGSIRLGDVYVAGDAPAGTLPILLYLLLRRGRIWGRHTVISYAELDVLGSERDVVEWQRLPHLPPLAAPGASAALMAVAQRLDIAIHKAEQASLAAGQEFLKQFFVPEAVETLDLHLDRFFRTEFFTAVYESRLSRQQYIYSMSNLHQFVRYTTRLIGRAVGLSNDEELRNHWLAHLSGEINHEKIIEKDLAHLGADVDYVVRHMVPNVHNQEFMVMQESVIGFHQDPVLFMAAPFAAEGWTARLDQRFMQGLETSVRSWGIENPRHVTSFLSSHINYDGGEDGHWEGTRKILGRYLDSDHTLQKFLNLVHLAMNAFERSYSSYVAEQRLWGALPTRHRAQAADAQAVGRHDAPC